MDKYAFFLDIDGTLSKRGVIHPDNIEMISKAQKMGHYVLINTGRSMGYIPAFLTENIQFDGIVCGLGADVRVHGTQIFSRVFSQNLLAETTKFFLSMPETVALFEGEDTVYYTKRWAEIENSIQITDDSHFITQYPDARISKIACSPVGHLALTPFLNDLYLCDQGHYYELGQRGCNKATGMLCAAKHLGIPNSHCVAIGDSANDEDMLRSAGIAVVMENGDEEMKKLATFVTSSVTDAGVAKAMKKIIM